MEITQPHGGSGGGGTPGGLDTEVQFNDGGSFGGDAGFYYDKTTGELRVDKVRSTASGNLTISGDTILNIEGTDINQTALNAFQGVAGGTYNIDAPSVIIRGGTTLGISNDNGSHIAYLDTTSQTEDRTLTTPDTDAVLVASINGVFADAEGNVTLSTGVVSGQATINFGASTQEDSIAVTTVNLASITSGSIVSVSPSGAATADHDPDDYQWDNISGYVSNIVNGVSFDIVGVAPNGSWGSYKFNYIIS